MKEDNLIALWKFSEPKTLPKIQREQLIASLKQEVSEFQRKIKNRNRRETYAAYLIIPTFLFYAYINSDIIAKVISIFVALWALGVILVFKHLKKQEPEIIQPSTLTYLVAYHRYIQLEMGMIRHVLYWYILPPSIAAILFFFRTYDGSLRVKLAYSTGVLLFAILVYLLNRRAVKKEFEPLLKQFYVWIHQIKNA